MVNEFAKKRFGAITTARTNKRFVKSNNEESLAEAKRIIAINRQYKVARILNDDRNHNCQLVLESIILLRE